ncbi:helix-turn-helix domain-containing protein [Lactococcus garvieae]
MEFCWSKIYSDFLKSTCNFKILEELFYGNFVNLELFAISQHMSIRAAQRSIQKLKLFLFMILR